MDGGKNNADPAPAEGEEGKERKEVEAAAPEEEEEEGEGEDNKEQSVGEENGDGEGGEEEEFDRVSEFPPPQWTSRTPFTSLTQIDADLALARTLQEQERAYVMLSRSDGEDFGGGGGGGDLVDFESGSEYDDIYHDHEVDEDDQLEEGSAVVDSGYDEDAFDYEDPTAGIDPSAFDDDESYARALQGAEELELAAQLMAFDGIDDWVAEDAGDYGNDAQVNDDVSQKMRQMSGVFVGVQRSRRPANFEMDHGLAGLVQVNLTSSESILFMWYIESIILKLDGTLI